MCLVTFAWQPSSSRNLVLVANRDERFDRESAPLAWWDDAPDILAGRDLVAGGTWLGVNRQGRFAIVTNYREPDPGAGERSRGELVTDWLTRDIDAATFWQELTASADLYSGYNLLFGHRDQLFYASNRSAQQREVESGLHALSNAELDTPWPKSIRVRRALERALQQDAIEHTSLLPMMQDAEPARDDELPDAHLPMPLRRALSSPFIPGERYGTRCSTVLTIEGDRITVTEQQYAPGGSPTSSQQIGFGAEPV